MANTQYITLTFIHTFLGGIFCIHTCQNIHTYNTHTSAPERNKKLMRIITLVNCWYERKRMELILRNTSLQRIQSSIIKLPETLLLNIHILNNCELYYKIIKHYK